MKNIFLIIPIIFLLTSCDNSNEVKTVDTFYSTLVNYDTEDEAESAKQKLEAIIRDTLIVKNNLLHIGQFENYRKASDKGFELFADTLIPNFNIWYEDSILTNDYTPLYFIGKYLDRPALYKTDITKIKPQLVWSKWGRKIMHLYRSDERESYYFTTTLHEALRGGFPLVMDTRIYRFNRSNEQVRLIKKIGNVMNINGVWENDSTFTTYFTILDSMITSNLVQYQYNFNPIGEIVDTTERIFELVRDGIPIPRITNINPISLNHRYKMTTVEKDSVLKLNIIDELNGTNNIITDLSGEIKENMWNASNDFLFLTTIVSRDSTHLLIINLETMTLIRKFSGIGEKNFINIGNLLIFDDKYDNESYITLFRYRRNEIYSEIKIIGGCGVHSIPKEEKIF